MKEDFLHFIWKEQLFDSFQLTTVDGQSVLIIDKGNYNHHSGPDFFNCQIKLDSILWAGNVEIHLRSSDWYRHQHQHDFAYENVILHVVLEHDMEVTRKDGSYIPTLILNNRFYKEAYYRYQRFFKSDSLIYPCLPHANKISQDIISSTLEKNLLDRIDDKSKIIFEQLERTKNNWDESFYHLLAKSFGFKVNAVPMQLLAESIPLTIIERESFELLKIESLLFGMAGLLDTINESAYQKKLKAEYKNQQNKYDLKSLHPSIWKFGKLRPSNFPTIRIAQFAMLLYKQKRIFKRCLNASATENLYKIFNVEASEYWTTHFHFENNAAPKMKLLGRESIDNIIINTIIPFCYAYGMHIGNKALLEKSIGWMNEMPAENNKFTRSWSKSNYKFRNAGDTQGLLQLNQKFCSMNKCVYCKIGSTILNLTLTLCEKPINK